MFVVLVIRNALCMCRIVSFVTCPARPYFSTLFKKSLDFRENITEGNVCCLIFSTNLFETFLILRLINPDIIISRGPGLA